MDLFRTPIPFKAKPFVVRSQNFVSLGSCFAESIGQKLLTNKWTGLVNPFGTLFHPFALFQFLEGEVFLDDTLFLESNGLAHHYRLPKTLVASDIPNLRAMVGSRHRAMQRELERPGSILLLTLGTSVLYSRGDDWVANCHQQPARSFSKSMTSIEAMTAAWYKVLDRIPAHTSIIVTVSPVRHQKEGLVQSSLSKAQLRVLAEAMHESAPERIHYFPAYEIMMDELRDYRFYARDMLHPTEEAIDYIWNRFQEAYLSPSAKTFCEEWGKIRSKLEHRPLHPQSESYRKFLEQLLKELDAFPDVGVQSEKQFIYAKLEEFQS